MVMTKEEKIKEAWGSYWDRLPEHQKKEALSNNGGVSIGYSELQTKLFKDLRNTKEFILEPCMPKSLLGIEDNNGWIKIDNKSDLPIERGYYFVIMNGKKTIMGYNPECQKWIGGGHYYFEPHGNLKITHYQKIDFPQDNIY